MTPPAAAAAPRTRTRRTAPPPRRVSGPARTTRSRAAGAGAHITAPPLALRLGGAVGSLAEHRFLDRLIRGRSWIAIVGIGLIGIVFMQVSMLRMNAGIGRDVDTASRLERDNAAMRASISELSSGNHIETEAAQMGLVLPTATPRFLDARGFDPARAVHSITAPGNFPAGVTATATDTTAASLAPTGVAASPDASTGTPATSSTTSTTGTATATTPTTTSTPTATTAPATATPTPSSSSTAQATPTVTPAPPPAATGGAAATPTGR